MAGLYVSQYVDCMSTIAKIEREAKKRHG